MENRNIIIILLVIIVALAAAVGFMLMNPTNAKERFNRNRKTAKN